MTLKSAFSNYYRGRLRYLCLNCGAGVFLKGAYFIGMSLSGRCKHDEEVKCSFETTRAGILVSYFCGLILSVYTIYDLCSSYDPTLSVWHVDNLRSLIIFFFGIAQSLVILCLNRNHKILQKLFQSIQYNADKLTLIVSEENIREESLFIVFQADFSTLLSACISITLPIYQYFIDGNFVISFALTIFAECQSTLGLVLLVTLHKTTLSLCHGKLKEHLSFSTDHQCSDSLLTQTASLQKDLDLILHLTITNYQSFRLISKIIFPALYIYLLNNLLAFCIVVLIVILKIMNAESFGFMDETTVLILSGLVFGAICMYACLNAQRMLDMNESTRSFIYRSRWCKLPANQIEKLETLLILLDNLKFEVNEYGLILLSNKLFATAIYVCASYIVVALQFYVANEFRNRT